MVTMSEKLLKTIRNLTAERDRLAAELAEAKAALAKRAAKPKAMTTRKRKPLDD